MLFSRVGIPKLGSGGPVGVWEGVLGSMKTEFSFNVLLTFPHLILYIYTDFQINYVWFTHT